jgi:hypothetical protein
MARAITLTRQAQSSGTSWGRLGFRFTVTASGGVNVENEIFRFLRRPVDPSDPDSTQEDVFSGICRPEEMSALPINAPQTDADPAWLRLATLDLVFASETDAEATWTTIQADVRTLLLALDKMDVLSVESVVTVAT